MAWDGLKWLEMTEIGQKWLEIAGNDSKWHEMSGNLWKWLETDQNGDKKENDVDEETKGMAL